MAASKKTKDPVMHALIPEHVKLSEKDKKALFEEHNISVQELPKIFLSDPALRGLDVKSDDVIKITRPSHTAGVAVSFRGVVNG